MYGVFNTKMTNTLKEGWVSEPAVDLADVPSWQRHASVLGKVEPKSETQTLRKSQQTLAILRIPRAVPWWGVACPMRRRAQIMSAICVAVSVTSPAIAQPEVIRCLPPEAPVTDLPEAVLAKYRTEIAAEFEAYFAAVSTHIACLDAERSRALSEARVATEAYATFLNTPPAQKDLP